jgi:putative transcriptional regulator
MYLTLWSVCYIIPYEEECKVIICTLAKIMARHKERNIADLARRTQLNRATIRALFEDTFSKIDRHTIDSLCKEYQVTPGDLLIYVPDKEQGAE